MTNSRKTLHRGKGVFGIALGSQRLYDWVGENQGLLSFPMDYVNQPSVMAQMENMISINNCIAIDLYGQVLLKAQAHAIFPVPADSWTFPQGLMTRLAGKALSA
ncbi:MAG: acetyl-CoA hydrolase/transferase C-terminal domain-containing protein [Anaerotignum sp.]